MSSKKTGGGPGASPGGAPGPAPPGARSGTSPHPDDCKWITRFCLENFQAPYIYLNEKGNEKECSYLTF